MYAFAEYVLLMEISKTSIPYAEIFESFTYSMHDI